MHHGSKNTWETAWHSNTGATHHLTNDATTLNLQKTYYNGVGSVQVGNGQGLQILKTRSSKISTPSSTFVLNQVLLVLKYQRIYYLCTSFVLTMKFILSFILIIFL